MIIKESSLHSLHPYPCKFPASIAQKYLAASGSVLDPYVGSGTTLLEGAMRGLDTYGFDCNPIALLITKAKLVNLSRSEFASLKELVIETYDFPLEKIPERSELPEFDGKDHWFSTQAQKEFTYLLRELSAYERDSACWIVIASAISSLTNTYSNQDSETRYAAVEKKHKKGDLIKAFSKKLDKTLNSLSDRGTLQNTINKISLGDIRLGIPLEENSIDQIITSPPYANTMDYYLYHKHRMNLLGYDFKQTQNFEIGSRHEFSSKKKDPEVWNHDYTLGLKEMLRILKPGGEAVVVIGDSQIAGNLISGAELTLTAANSLGATGKVLESVSMTGKSRTFRASFQAPNKFEHIISVRK